MGIKVLWFGLTASSFRSMLPVKQIGVRVCRLSAKCAYCGIPNRALEKRRTKRRERE